MDVAICIDGAATVVTTISSGTNSATNNLLALLVSQGNRLTVCTNGTDQNLSITASALLQ